VKKKRIKTEQNLLGNIYIHIFYILFGSLSLIYQVGVFLHHWECTSLQNSNKQSRVFRLMCWKFDYSPRTHDFLSNVSTECPRQQWMHMQFAMCASSKEFFSKYRWKPKMYRFYNDDVLPVNIFSCRTDHFDTRYVPATN